MQYIDTARISHDLPARVSYIQSFVNFEPDTDGALITASKPYFTSDILTTINRKLIDKLLDYDITRVPFTHPKLSGKGDCKVEDLHAKHPNVQYARFAHQLLGGISGNDDWSPTGKLWDYFDKVGRVHIGIDDTGLPSRKNKAPLKVNTRELALMIGWLESTVIDVLMQVPDLSMEQKSLTIRAWNKYWWIHHDLFAKHQSTGLGDKASALGSGILFSRDNIIFMFVLLAVAVVFGARLLRNT